MLDMCTWAPPYDNVFEIESFNFVVVYCVVYPLFCMESATKNFVCIL